MLGVYGVLCVLGLVLPYAQFVPWLLEYGLDLPRLVREASGGRISAFAWSDVLVTAAALLVFIVAEGRREGLRLLGLPILATLLVGPSLGLPLFLLLRHKQRQRFP